MKEINLIINTKPLIILVLFKVNVEHKIAEFELKIVDIELKLAEFETEITFRNANTIGIFE